MDLIAFRSFVDWLRQPRVTNLVALACAPAVALALLIPASLALSTPDGWKIALALSVWSYASTALLIPAANWGRKRKIEIRGPIRFPLYLVYGVATGLLIAVLGVTALAMIYALTASNDVHSVPIMVQTLFHLEWFDLLKGLSVASLINAVVFHVIADTASKQPSV